MPCVLIASGRTPFDELARLAPAAAFSDWGDTAAIHTGWCDYDFRRTTARARHRRPRRRAPKADQEGRTDGGRVPVVVAKDFLKFSAGHSWPTGGSRAPARHNYQVSVAITVGSCDGYVIDFVW